MINHLRHMAVFARVVDQGTFRAAAKDLNIAPSRVSQTVSDLEQHLGVTLFHRTTRKLVLTYEGKQFYTHISEMIHSAESGLNVLNALSEKPVGKLRITLPGFLEGPPLSTAIAGFLETHPDVSLCLQYTDQVLNILDESLDVCIRAGVGGIDDSAMMSRKLGETKRILISSKTYLHNRPTPKHPAELQDWDWISFQMRPNILEFFSASGEKASVSESSRISVSSVNALKHFINEGIGITIVSENIVQNELKAGDFVHVLPQWKVIPLEYYAIWPDKSRRENLTMTFVRYIAEHLQSSEDS